MNTSNRLRNKLIRKIQQLSTNKLSEINKLLSKIENQLKSKENTLKLGGSWKDFDDKVFKDFTVNLHNNRAKDRHVD